MKVEHKMNQIEFAIYSLEQLAEAGMNLVGLATLGNLAINAAAELAVNNDPALALRFNSEAVDTGVEPDSGPGFVLRAIAYLRFMEECRKNGTCACGDPACVPNRGGTRH